MSTEERLKKWFLDGFRLHIEYMQGEYSDVTRKKAPTDEELEDVWQRLEIAEGKIDFSTMLEGLYSVHRKTARTMQMITLLNSFQGKNGVARLFARDYFVCGGCIFVVGLFHVRERLAGVVQGEGAEEITKPKRHRKVRASCCER